MTTPFPFVSGQVLTAEQLNDIQNLPISDKTASYTLLVGDVTKRTIMNSASATTITVDDAIFTVGDVIQVVNKGAGTCTITAGAGVTINTSGSLDLAQYGGGYLVAISASSFVFFNLGGAADYFEIEFLTVAGGGGGGTWDASTFFGGGGGAGGYRNSVSGEQTGGGGTAENPAIIKKGEIYTITVGGGGATQTIGTNSSILGYSLSLVSTGGGHGGGTIGAAGAGGSGGGGKGQANGAGGGVVSPTQGFAGGAGGGGESGGGGGGANAVGTAGVASNGGDGAAGKSSSITGSAVTRAGGGGSAGNTTNGAGGAGGGGAGSSSGGVAGGTNLGGGGGGGGIGGAGGSGVIILRTPDTIADASTLTVGTKTSSGGYTIYTFNASGTIGWS
jgi:hypothetical protein